MVLQINIVLLMMILILECFGLPSAHQYPHKAHSRYSKNVHADIPLRMESEDRKVNHRKQEDNCNECGRQPLKTDSEGGRSGRIVNATTVKPPNKYPWMVYITVGKGSKSKFCGGVIISANFILTAAHCMRRSKTFDWQNGSTCGNYTAGTSEPCYYKKDDVSVQLLTDTYDTRKGPPVAEVLPHPEFNVSTHLENDIALLRLSHSIQCNEYAMPICLPLQETNILVGTQVIVTGWGRTHSLNKTSAEKLQEGNMTIIDKKNCSISDDLETWFCLSGEGKLTTCYGDSGGPMMYKSKGKFFTLGVLSGGKSHGTRKCNLTKLSKYTKVQYFLSWIYNVSDISPSRI